MYFINNLKSLSPLEDKIELNLLGGGNKGIVIEDMTDFNKFINLVLSKDININNLNLGLGTYYNMLGNIELIKNINNIIDTIINIEVKKLSIQIPFLKDSFLSTIGKFINFDILIRKIINNNIEIEFIINNYLDIYLIKEIYNLYPNLKINLSIGPQYFFLNYDPLNLEKKDNEEFNNFLENTIDILVELENKFNINISNLYFYLGHIAYFYGLEHFNFYSVQEFINKLNKKVLNKSKEYNIIIFYNKTIFSVTDRYYHYFNNLHSQKGEISTRISNQEIIEWLYENIEDIQDNPIKGEYNYSIFKGLNQSSLEKIDSFYNNSYEYYTIKL